MSEQQTADASTQDGNTTTSGTTSDAGDKFEPITSQDELNRVIGERIDRERAKFADYKDLKAKASKFDELEAANQSELEKANNAKTAAEERAAQAEAAALRLRVAAKHGISDEDADLFLTGTDEETLTKQATRLGQHASDRKKNGNVVPKEGSTASAGANEELAAARELFGSRG